MLRRFNKQRLCHSRNRLRVREISGLGDYTKAQLAARHHTITEFRCIRKELLRQLRIIQSERRGHSG